MTLLVIFVLWNLPVFFWRADQGLAAQRLRVARELLLELAEIKGELKKKITQLCKYDLLIIDELGYLPMNKQSNHSLFQLINAVYEFRSVILTTNKVD